jgi:hypothetical protein
MKNYFQQHKNEREKKVQWRKHSKGSQMEPFKRIPVEILLSVLNKIQHFSAIRKRVLVFIFSSRSNIGKDGWKN